MQPRALPLIAVLVAPVALGAEVDPRSNRVVCTVEASICARARVASNETVVQQSDATTRTTRTLWSVPSWLRVVRISGSGESILVETRPFNQWPVEPTSDTVVLQIYRAGKLHREYRAGEFFVGAAELQAAVRAPAWAMGVGSNEDDIAKYLLASGRRASVNLTTERVVIE